MRLILSLPRNNMTDIRSNKIDTFILYALFFLSGLSGLIYESAWSQQLALIFGSTELAIAAVLSSYMAGLALGAKLIGFFIHRIQKPIKTYAILEIAIAISALIVPFLLDLVSDIYRYFYSTDKLTSISTSNALIYVVGSFIVLLIPTSLMGATLPLLSQFVVKQDDNVGNKIGRLYSTNTLGACGGALVSAFVLLPLYGLGLTVFFAVSINVIIFFVGIYYFNNKRFNIEISNKPIISKYIYKNLWILPLILISGAISFGHEILWVRLLSHILGSSIYSFGVMLFVFLLAIALGAFLGGLLCKKHSAIKSFIWVQLAIAICFLVSFYLADNLVDLRINADYGSLSFVFESLFIGFLTLLPGAIFIGMTFPLAINIVAIDNKSSGLITARVYSWNTVGAICGSLLMGFFLLSHYGFATSTKILCLGSILLALITSGFLKKVKTMLSLSALICFVWVFPLKDPLQLLKYSTLGHQSQQGEIHYLGIGESATVILLDQGAEMRLLTNGLPESSVQMDGKREGKFFLAHWLSALPTLMNPKAENMLIVGLGAGLTLKAVPPSIKQIDVVELEEEVIKANQRLSEWRGKDPLKDPRLKIHTNDARNALRNSTQKFDIIVSQPSHPWTAGASSLYTQEFFSTVNNHLNDNGVFIQWIGMRFIDEELLKSLLSTLNSEFNHVQLYQPLSNSGLIFASSNQPIKLDREYFEKSENKNQWLTLGINHINQIDYSLRLTSKDSKVFSKDAKISTDYFNVLKVRSPKIIKQSLNKLKLNVILAGFDPLLNHINSKTFIIVRQLIKERAYYRLNYLTNAIENNHINKTVKLIINHSKHKTKDKNIWDNLLLARLIDIKKNTESNYKESIQEIMYYLMNYHINYLFTNYNLSNLLTIIHEDPFAKEIINAWREVKLKKRNKVKELDKHLNTIDYTHPAFNFTTKLEKSWKKNSKEIIHQQRAMKLIDEELVFFISSPVLIEKINLAIKMKNYNMAIATLYELRLLVPKTNNDHPKLVMKNLTQKIANHAQDNFLYTHDLKTKISNFIKLL